LSIIIQNSFILQHYEFKNIDNQIFLTINNCPTIPQNKETLKNLLSAFSFITDNNLSYLDLSTIRFQNIIDNFWHFLHKENIDLSPNFLTNMRGYLLKWIDYLKSHIPELQNYQINKKKKIFDFQFNKEKVDYIQGWFLQGKDNNKQIFINLISFYNILGKEKTKLIHKNAQQYASKFELESIKSFLVMINEFSNFLSKENPKELANKLYSDVDLYNLIKNFCFYFFNKEQKEKRVLYISKNKWNKFIEGFTEIFLDGNILPKSFTDLPRAPQDNVRGIEKRIKIQNGVEVKSKLITEIPLNITDDVALEILFKKINSDLNLAVDWANCEIKELLNSYNYQFNTEFFGKSPKYIKRSINLGLNDIKHTLLTTNSLEPFMFLLINEHPQITESFLLNFELYDNNNLVGYIKTDSNHYLVGYKKRRGPDLAEQKILLNEKSKNILDTLIKLTKNYREYLKAQNNGNWRYLFLHGGEHGINPQRFLKTFVPAPSKFHMQEAKKRIEFILNKVGCSIDEAQRFVTNMTMTKLRASKAVTLYLIQNDTKKMAEALGHKEYKPELLSFYLPKPILDFFQSRWIRIFQKGIICEAMKDSENLFKASNFNSMSDLEEFIKLHALKNIPDIKPQSENKKLNLNDQVYIGVNKEILAILLSLEKAVELAENEVSATALYWSKFSSRLQEEIMNNKVNIQFVKDLEKAKAELNPQNFKEIIYDK
jgi:hypothetical protein